MISVCPIRIFKPCRGRHLRTRSLLLDVDYLDVNAVPSQGFAKLSLLVSLLF